MRHATRITLVAPLMLLATLVPRPALAQIDLTGDWVSIVTEDWRWRATGLLDHLTWWAGALKAARGYIVAARDQRIALDELVH